VNRLRLNPAKTRIIWLGSKRQVKKVNILDVSIMATSVSAVINSARDLGVIVDSHLMMMTHVSAVCHAAYYQLRQLHRLIRLLSFDAAKLLVQAFISTRLYFCNSLLYGISNSLYRHLQAVQNAAARLITNTRTPILQQVHWLPAHQRTNVFNSRSPCRCTLHNLLPVYLAEDCHLVSVTGHR